MDIRLPPEFLKKLQPENEHSPLCKPLSRMSRRASLVCDICLRHSVHLISVPGLVSHVFVSDTGKSHSGPLGKKKNNTDSKLLSGWLTLTYKC